MSEWISSIATGIWTPVLVLIILGGCYFLYYSRMVHYRYMRHCIDVLRGKYHDPKDPGQITPYEALSTALASTVGMGNIAGVAAAIALGGPGALFWMWVTALVGMTTNFFTSTLAVMYRGKDSEGEIQGGPMYVIREALGKKWMPLAILFSVCCLIGCLPIFQANQLTQAIIDIGVNSPEARSWSFGFFGFEVNTLKFCVGIVLTIISGIVLLGGIHRIGTWAGKMVPLMIMIYFGCVMTILLVNLDQVPGLLWMVITDAFTASHSTAPPAILGGVVGGMIVAGVRRASFSNEAGIGTAPMALGASQSKEPIREGLVSMMSPAIDTLIVCTLTALAILISGVWKTEASGVTMTALAFESALGSAGKYLLLLCAFFFAITSLFSYSYYGGKALAFLVGVKGRRYYDYLYLFTITIGAVSSMSDVINIIDIAFGLMAIPTMLSGLALAPRVMDEAKRYFAKLKEEK